MSKIVYATLPTGTRIGAARDGDRILVHRVNGRMIGWYDFPHEKLTPATLLATVLKK